MYKRDNNWHWVFNLRNKYKFGDSESALGRVCKGGARDNSSIINSKNISFWINFDITMWEVGQGQKVAKLINIPVAPYN